MAIRPREVIDFWMAAGPGVWFARSDDFDAEIRRQFGALHREVTDGGYSAWREFADGALALILILDQFSRNLFRDHPNAFRADAMALGLARHAVARGFDLELVEAERRWLYMPFMHAEDLAAQKEGLGYFSQRLNDPETLRFAEEHYDIIRRFGRFPHRNPVLGREMSPQEQSYLDAGGFRG